MKTKAKSVQVLELRLWSKRYFVNKGTIDKPAGQYENNIYDGFITDAKSKKKIFFKTPAQMMNAIEKLFKKAEGKYGRKFK